MMLNAMLWLARSGAAWADNTTDTELQLKSFLKILIGVQYQIDPTKSSLDIPKNKNIIQAENVFIKGEG